MSRSRKKAIYKDKGFRKKDYWKTVRRVHKVIIQKHKSDFIYDYHGDFGKEFNLPNPKSIVNDYDYCDYIYNMETITLGELKIYTHLTKEYIESFRRK